MILYRKYKHLIFYFFAYSLITLLSSGFFTLAYVFIYNSDNHLLSFIFFFIFINNIRLLRYIYDSKVNLLHSFTNENINLAYQKGIIALSKYIFISFFTSPNINKIEYNDENFEIINQILNSFNCHLIAYFKMNSISLLLDKTEYVLDNSDLLEILFAKQQLISEIAVYFKDRKSKYIALFIFKESISLLTNAKKISKSYVSDSKFASLEKIEDNSSKNNQLELFNYIKAKNETIIENYNIINTVFNTEVKKINDYKSFESRIVAG